MSNLDKDLASIQEVRNLVQLAKKSQVNLAKLSQSEIDRICKAISEAGAKNAVKLAKMAHEETGFGIWEDKVLKNLLASTTLYDSIKDMKTIGEIGRDEKIRMVEYGVPMGVIAGIIPSTNPTSTVIYKTMISIKAGNAIVISPHPGGKNAIIETVKILKEAIVSCGGDADWVGVITTPTLQATDTLMKNPDVSMILATGGGAMVKAAYSSGNPAIGVGPGNSPAFIEKSADLKLAVKRILDSKTFDNGTICASEQSVICEEDMETAVIAEMKSQGAYFLNDNESKQLGDFILRANGTMNPQIVGKSVQTISKLAGLNIPTSARVIVAKETGVGKGHPYSNEKLAPILGFYVEKDYKAVCDKCAEILNYEGAGHTFNIHSNNDEIIKYFAMRIPVSRFLINTPGALGGVGATTGLAPAFTLGCGAVGGSSTSENITPLHLMNIRRVMHGLSELSDIRNSAPTQSNTSSVDIDSIVKKVIEKLQAN